MKATDVSEKIFNLWRLSTIAFRGYAWHIALLAVFGFVSGILEGIGINALVPLFSFAQNDAPQTNALMEVVRAGFLSVGVSFSLLNLLIFIICLFVAKALVVVFLEYLRLRITSEYEAKTRGRLLGTMLSAKWPHHLRHRSGHLETILLVDVPAASGLLSQISSAIINITSLIVYIVVALSISAASTLSAILLGLAVFAALFPLAYRIKRLSFIRTRENKEMSHQVSQAIGGVKTIKSLVAEQKVLVSGKRVFNEIKKLTIGIGFLKSAGGAAIQPLGVIFVSVLVAWMYFRGQFDLAALIAIVYLIQQIFINIQQLQRTSQTMIEYLPHVKSVIDYEQQSRSEAENDTGSMPFVFTKSIAMRQIDFSYDQKKPVLNAMSFEISKGEMVGMIGPSGVGKTTVVDILLRLLQPTSGIVEIDGVNAESIKLAAWRRGIGYVSQDVFLINDTIFNNIAFYDETISKQDVIAAAQQANLLEFINSLPKQFDTEVGERGVMLSAGQRQRIAIARVLARKPQMLILDEATSALDNESEAQIQSVIKKLKGATTVLVIAHRLSTIMDADRLVVVNNGIIEEEGAPEELLQSKDSYFFKVYNIKNE